MAAKNIKLLAGIGVGVLVLVGGAVWLLTRGPETPAETAAVTAEEAAASIAPEALDKLSGDERTNHFKNLGRRLGKADREERSRFFDQTELAEEDRRNLRSGMMEVRREEMRKEIDEFFAAPPEKQNELLDKRIDEFMEMRKRRERERQARQKETAKGDEKKDAGDRRGRRDRWKNASHDEKEAWARERLNRHDPEERAKFMAYWQRLRERMKERGVEFGRRGRH